MVVCQVVIVYEVIVKMMDEGGLVDRIRWRCSFCGKCRSVR